MVTEVVGRQLERDALGQIRSLVSEIDLDDPEGPAKALRVFNDLGIPVRTWFHDLDRDIRHEVEIQSGETFNPRLAGPVEHYSRGYTFKRGPARPGSVGTPSSLVSATIENTAASATTSGTITPTGDALLIAVFSGRAGAVRSFSSVSDTLTGTGSWSEHGGPTALSGTQGYGHIFIASGRAGSSPGSGTVTFNTDDTCLIRILWVFEVAGTDTTTPVGNTGTATANDDTGTTIATSLSSVDGDGRSFAAITDLRSNTQDAGGNITPGSGETELAEEVGAFSSIRCRAQVSYGTSLGASTTPDWGGLVRDSTAALAIELKPVAAGTTVASEEATATAAANAPTIAIVQDATVSGEEATATAAAAAPTPEVAPESEEATASGVANAPTPSIAVSSEEATATATANAPTIDTGANPSVAAEPATATAAANAPTPSLAPDSEEATASAAANSPTPSIAAASEEATATAAANPPTLSVDETIASAVATATAAAQAPTPAIDVPTAQAAATGAANAPTVVLQTDATISSEEAAATATANVPTSVGAGGTPRTASFTLSARTDGEASTSTSVARAATIATRVAPEETAQEGAE